MADSGSCYRVAVASTDGVMVDRHFGRAEKFFVYAVNDDEGYDLYEERSVTPLCNDGSHLKADMEKSVMRFSDCRYVVASKIGVSAAQSLATLGVSSMELPGSVDDAIVRVWKYNRVQNLFDTV